MPDFTILVKPHQWPMVIRLRNGIPGPFLAKLSPLWKVIHVLRNTYRPTVAKLHKRYGPLVQIGPNEYSLSDKGIVYIPKLAPTFFAVDLAALQDLQESVSMASVFQYEHLIEKCNWQLCCLLIDAADQGKALEITPLLARYAYDTMLATTTGQLGGFLENKPDATRIATQLNKWKFYAILYGGYLKFHPLISQILRACGLRGAAEHKVFAGTDTSKSTSKSQSDAEEPDAEDAPSSTTQHRYEKPKPLTQDTEARIALTLAGTDPAIILIRTALRYIYSDPQLLQKLREEIAQADLSPTPLFKELISQRFQMPLLHAVLLECIRLNPPIATGPTFTTREEDVQVGGHRFPKDTTISLEPTVAHVNPNWFGDDAADFEPTRWLNFEIGREARRHLLAFNLAFDRTNKLEEFQILLTCKLLVQLVPHVTMSFNDHVANPNFNVPGSMPYDHIVINYCDALLNIKPVITHGENSSATGASISRKTVNTLSRQELFHCNFNEETLKALCAGGRFDSSKSSFAGEPTLITNPISLPMARAKTREAFKDIYGRRLWWTHDVKTDCILISPPGQNKHSGNQSNNKRTYTNKNTQSKTFRSAKGSASPNNNARAVINKEEAAVPNEHVPTHVRQRVAPKNFMPTGSHSEGTSKFRAFGIAEEAHMESYTAAYGEAKSSIDQAYTAAEKDGKADFKMAKSIFKQTCIKENEKVDAAEAEAKADEPKSKPLPPHLRKKVATN